MIYLVHLLQQQELENYRMHLQKFSIYHLCNYIKEIDQLLKKIYSEEYYSLDLLKFYNPLTFKLKI